MRRRNFLKVAAAALFAPAALVKADEPKKKPRIFYATKKVEFGPLDPNTPDVIVGKQSIGAQTKWTQDVLISPEAMEDIRNWGVDTIDEQTRKEILRAGWSPKIEMGYAILDNRKVLLGDFDGSA